MYIVAHRVTVLHKLRNKPTLDMDHFVLDVLILSEAHRRPAARCIEDIVVYDYQKGQKCSLLPFMAEKFGEVFELQEKEREKNSERIQSLLANVRRLEKDSWDRADAQEDMGSMST